MNSEPQAVTEAPPDLRKPVLYGDFYPHAKKTCPTCIGLGYFQVAVKIYREGPKDAKGNPTRVQKPGLGEATNPKVCGCAIKRFMKKHGASVTTRPDGALVWNDPIHKDSGATDG